MQDIAENLIEGAASILSDFVNDTGHDEDICPCDVCSWLRDYELYSGKKAL